jgi:hypothetical protein
MRARALSWVGLALGCGLAPPDDEAGGGSSEAGGSETSSASGDPNEFEKPVPCESTAECAGGHCVAPYDPGAADPLGPSVCVAPCVGMDALDRACVDDQACCALLVCDEHGLCVEPDAAEETTTG